MNYGYSARIIAPVNISAFCLLKYLAQTKHSVNQTGDPMPHHKKSSNHPKKKRHQRVLQTA